MSSDILITRFDDEALLHYGRKGMKWHKHIFAKDKKPDALKARDTAEWYQNFQERRRAKGLIPKYNRVVSGQPSTVIGRPKRLIEVESTISYRANQRNDSTSEKIAALRYKMDNKLMNESLSRIENRKPTNKTIKTIQKWASKSLSDIRSTTDKVVRNVKKTANNIRTNLR